MRSGISGRGPQQDLRRAQEARRPRAGAARRGADGSPPPHRLLDHTEGPSCPLRLVGDADSGSGARVRVAREGVLLRVRVAAELATLEATRRWSVEQTLATGEIADEYLGGDGPYPDRLPWLVLVAQFLDDFLVLVENWATWAAVEVADWPDDVIGARPISPRRGQARRFQAATDRGRDQCGVRVN